MRICPRHFKCLVHVLNQKQRSLCGITCQSPKLGSCVWFQSLKSCIPYGMDICNATGNSGAEWRQPSDIGSGSAGDVVQSCVGSTTMLSTKGTVEAQHAKWLGWKQHRHSYRHFFPALLQGRSEAKAPKHKATTANQSRHEALRLPNERGARTTVPRRQRQQKASPKRGLVQTTSLVQISLI